MTVGQAIKSAVLRADGTQIVDVFGSTEQVALEMADLCNEAARDIADAYDWRILTKIGVLVGDSVQTAFDVPDDYDRMASYTQIADPRNWFWTYAPFRDVNDWLAYTNSQQGMMIPGGWIVLGNQFNFYPAPTGDAQLIYISKNFAESDSGVPKPEFTADNDRFLLSERLLTLALIWRWKAQKGMEYGEDMANYEKLLAKLQMDDRGAREIRGRPRLPANGLSYAYPWQLG